MIINEVTKKDEQAGYYNILEKLQSYEDKWNKYSYNPYIDNELFYEETLTSSERTSRSFKGAQLMFKLNFRDNFIFGLIATNEHGSDKAKINEFYITSKSSSFNKFIIYAGYYLGALFSAMLFPSFFWSFFLINNRKDKKSILLKEKNMINEIKEHPNYGNDFTKKIESLDKLLKNKTLDKEDFTTRRKKLIKNYYKPIEDEKRAVKREQIEKELKEALELGTITQRVYNARMGIRTRR